MARMARVVVPQIPHHVTQRGNRGQRTFFGDDDYAAYLHLLAQYCRKAGTQVLAYCLMPNHVHLVMVPQHEDGLRNVLGEVHRRYTRRINERYDWRGHLWQERFYSFPMDEPHLLAAVRYVERNPVAAGLCTNAEDWPWSSVRAHLQQNSDGFVDMEIMRSLVDDWSAYLADDGATDTRKLLARHSRTGRPLGDKVFVRKLEKMTGRALAPRRSGRKKRHDSESVTEPARPDGAEK